MISVVRATPDLLERSRAPSSLGWMRRRDRGGMWEKNVESVAGSDQRPLRIAVIGLGVMGRPIAENLISAGLDVHVANRSLGAVDALARLGATPHSSTSAAAARAEVVITVLPDGPDVMAIGIDPGGIIESLASGGLWIDMSTISPTTARSVALAARAKGIEFIDAPVSGGQQGARSATLTIMVGGSAEAVARATPIFGLLAKSVTHIGPVGAGQVAKAANQILVGGTIALVAEVMTLVRREGLDPVAVREALLGGFAASRVLEVQGKRMIDRDFEPGFRVGLQHKDLSIALELARSDRMALPVTAVIRELYSSLRARPAGDDADHSAVVTVLEALAGMVVEDRS